MNPAPSTTKISPVLAPVAPKQAVKVFEQAEEHRPSSMLESQLPSTPPEPAVNGGKSPAPTTVDSDSTAAKATILIANEAALDLEDLKDEVQFTNLGVDSLMSLVIADKFREELGVTISGSLFLEYPTVGDLRAWLREYYS